MKRLEKEALKAEKASKKEARASGVGRPASDRDFYPQDRYLNTKAAQGIRAMLEGNLPDEHKKPTDFELKRIVRYAFCILGWTIEKISLSCEVPSQEISKIVVRNNFPAMRQRIDDRAFLRAVRQRERGIEQVVAVGTEIMLGGLRKYLKDPSSLEVKDVKFVSDITANAHRIHQLMQGKETSIRGEKKAPLTKEEIRAGLKELVGELTKDPMFDLPTFLAEHGLSEADVH